jgi:hypothetical protein
MTFCKFLCRKTEKRHILAPSKSAATGSFFRIHILEKFLLVTPSLGLLQIHYGSFEIHAVFFFIKYHFKGLRLFSTGFFRQMHVPL